MQPTGVAIAQAKLERGPDAPSRHEIYRMFDRIARRYDLLNRLLSFGQDILWRKKLARLLEKNKCAEVLDLATGTADVLLSAFKHNRHMQIGVGLDLAEQMLAIARIKVAKGNLAEEVMLIKGDAASLPVLDNTFDAVAIAFGIRNVMDVGQALNEMQRVIKTSGKVYVMEFSIPKNALARRLFLFYLRYILPFVGGLVSGDKTAYRYLNETVESFPHGHEFAELMTRAGYNDIKIHSLTFGVAAIYEGTK